MHFLECLVFWLNDIFFKINVCIVIQTSLNFISKGPIDNSCQLGQWLDACRQQAITWTNINLTFMLYISFNLSWLMKYEDIDACIDKSGGTIIYETLCTCEYHMWDTKNGKNIFKLISKNSKLQMLNNRHIMHNIYYIFLSKSHGK